MTAFGESVVGDIAVLSYITATSLLGVYVANQTLNYDCPYLDEQGDYLLSMLAGAQAGALFGVSLLAPFVTLSAVIGLGVSVAGFIGIPVEVTLLCNLFRPTSSE